MRKEMLQGPKESSGSNYDHKEILIYPASNHSELTTLIVIFFTDNFLTQLFSVNLYYKMRKNRINQKNLFYIKRSGPLCVVNSEDGDSKELCRRHTFHRGIDIQYS